MADRSFIGGLGAVDPNRQAMLGGNFTVTTGAVSAESGAQISGGTVTQTGSEDGRYGIAFYKTVKRVIFWGCCMQGPDDAGFPTTTGSDPQTRLVTTAGFSVQFKRTDTQADADPADGTVCAWWACVEI